MQKKDTDSSKESKMQPKPEYIKDGYQSSDKLKDKVAIVSGGDSGIGRAVCVHFAREGARVALLYHSSDEDAQKTKDLIEAEGQEALAIKLDITKVHDVKEVVAKVVDTWGQINILVNNAAYQRPQKSLTDISDEQLHKTFATNVFGHFYLSRQVLPHLSKGDCIINTTSVTTYRGSHHLIDYASTKGALVGFTRSLAKSLAPDEIRVNAVAPGPIWTPLIPETFDEKNVRSFGEDVPLGRPGQPSEVAPAFVFLASSDSSYITGQVIHPNGGEIVGS